MHITKNTIQILSAIGFLLFLGICLYIARFYTKHGMLWFDVVLFGSNTFINWMLYRQKRERHTKVLIILWGIAFLISFGILLTVVL